MTPGLPTRVRKDSGTGLQRASLISPIRRVTVITDRAPSAPQETRKGSFVFVHTHTHTPLFMILAFWRKCVFAR